MFLGYTLTNNCLSRTPESATVALALWSKVIDIDSDKTFNEVVNSAESFSNVCAAYAKKRKYTEEIDEEAGVGNKRSKTTDDSEVDESCESENDEESVKPDEVVVNLHVKKVRIKNQKVTNGSTCIVCQEENRVVVSVSASFTMFKKKIPKDALVCVQCCAIKEQLRKKRK